MTNRQRSIAFLLGVIATIFGGTILGGFGGCLLATGALLFSLGLWGAQL
jgi:hypothetical protein